MAAATSSLAAVPPTAFLTLVPPRAGDAPPVIASAVGAVAASGVFAAGGIAPKPLSKFRSCVDAVFADGLVKFDEVLKRTTKAVVKPFKFMLPEWGNFSPHPKAALQSGLRNAVYAVFDGGERNRIFAGIDPDLGGAVATIEEVFPGQKLPANQMKLRAEAVKASLRGAFGENPELFARVLEFAQGFIVETHSHIGSRPYNEDRMFIRKNLWGAFDGHGGTNTVETANRDFPKRFPDNLQKTGGNAYAALQLTAYDVAWSVAKNVDASEAAVVHVDDDFQLHALTIGDCVVQIYRKIGGEIKCIPIGVHFDWYTNQEATRAKAAGADVVQSNPVSPLPCNLVAPNAQLGVPNSRALGELLYQQFDGKPLVLSRPNISFFPALEPGDIILIMTDGYEHLPRARQRIVEIINAKPACGVAKAIVEESAAQPESDNSSVVSIEVCG
jgi:serine/threonine protein phosphatase PrpC